MVDSKNGLPADAEEQAKAKELIYWEKMLSGFIESRRELDRSLLTLSSAGIGVLVTLLSTLGVGSLLAGLLCILAVVAFLSTIILALILLRADADYFADILKSKKAEDRKLERLDYAIFRTFIAALVLSVFLGVAQGADQLRLKEKEGGDEMAKSDQGEVVVLKKSQAGLAELAPAQPMQPEAPAPASAATPPQTSPQTSKQSGGE